MPAQEQCIPMLRTQPVVMPGGRDMTEHFVGEQQLAASFTAKYGQAAHEVRKISFQCAVAARQCISQPDSQAMTSQVICKSNA